MKSTSKIILVIVAIIAFLSITCISINNGLVTSEENVTKYKADIEAQLQRRADLVPNLVNTVKGYANHENEIFAAVSDARTKLTNAATMQEQAVANDELNYAVSRLIALAEAYPELKANENFLELQAQLEGTENRISVARIAYNGAVQTYNAKIRRFPGSVFANITGLEKAEYFKGTEKNDTVPEIVFGN